jgi:hypothetical protein
MRIKQVTEADAEQVAELFALAFFDDPTWSWAFPEPSTRMEHQQAWWGLCVHSAVPYERLGFVQVGEFAAPGGEPTLACMWRDPR